MKILKTICSLILVALLLCGGVSASQVPENSARACVLIEADSGEVIFENNKDERLGPASTTKIMTALVALEHMAAETAITFDARAEGVEGSSAYMRAGEKYTLEELLYAMMLQSANDVATCIAYAVGGSVENFAVMMNEKAAELGLENTHFENPHGLDGESHYTSAYDLALIAREALKNETFAKIVSSKTATVGEGENTRSFRNHNRLLFEYEDITGVKTGFTKRCGRTLVSSAEKDGVRLICVTLSDGNDWRDHRRMLDAGFEMYESVVLCKKGAMRFNVHVCGGQTATVSVSNADEKRITLKKDHGEIEMRTELPPFVYADIHKGDIIGYVRFYLDGEEMASCGLYATDDCLKSSIGRNK